MSLRENYKCTQIRGINAWVMDGDLKSVTSNYLEFVAANLCVSRVMNDFYFSTSTGYIRNDAAPIIQTAPNVNQGHRLVTLATGDFNGSSYPIGGCGYFPGTTSSNISDGRWTQSQVNGFVKNQVHLVDVNFNELCLLCKVRILNDDGTESDYTPTSSADLVDKKIAQFGVIPYISNGSSRGADTSVRVIVLDEMSIGGYQWLGNPWRYDIVANGISGILAFGTTTQTYPSGGLNCHISYHYADTFDFDVASREFSWLMNYKELPYIEVDDMKHTYFTIDMVKDYLNNLGMYYTFVGKSASNSTLGSGCTDIEIFLPLRDSDGNPTGGSSSGSDIKNNPYADYTDISTIPNAYDPDGHYDPNDYTDDIEIGAPSLSAIGLFANYFEVSYNTVGLLNDFLWNTSDSKFEQIVKGLQMMGNPIDCIVNLKMYPFNLSEYGYGDTKEIVLGRTGTSIMARELPSNYNCVIDMGTVNFFNYFQNYLDYEPYTNAYLMLPYIGIVPISCKTFCGHDINVKYVIDVITGQCAAVISLVTNATSCIISTHKGYIAQDITVTADNSTQITKQVLNSAIDGVGQIGNIAAGAATGNVGGAISGASGLVSNAVNTSFDTSTITPTSKGSTTALIGTYLPQSAYLIVERPVESDAINFAEYNGYLVNSEFKMSRCHGFVSCANVIIDSSSDSIITDMEIKEIQSLLESGVYI